mgnify:FL=1
MLKKGAQVYDIARKYPAAVPLTTRRFSPRLEIGRLIPNYRESLTVSKLFMANKDDNQHVYRVLFQNQDQVYEVYARNIYQSELYGFVEIEDYTFSNKSQVVIDPSEEKLRNEFEGVQRSFVPMHAVIRIDEVEKEGVAKITATDGSTVTPFPMPVPTDR